MWTSGCAPPCRGTKGRGRPCAAARPGPIVTEMSCAPARKATRSLASKLGDDWRERAHRPLGQRDVADPEALPALEEVLDDRATRAVEEERRAQHRGDRGAEPGRDALRERAPQVGDPGVEDDHVQLDPLEPPAGDRTKPDRKSTRLNSSHITIS